jgi:hypothetical protein
MAQGFSCFCGAATCRGFISGAKNMTSAQLEGVWLNAHIRALLEERDAGFSTNRTLLPVSRNSTEKGIGSDVEIGDGRGEGKDETEEALKLALVQARKMVDAAQKALDTYKSIHGGTADDVESVADRGASRQNGVGNREMSGEMGGDTLVEA